MITRSIYCLLLFSLSVQVAFCRFNYHQFIGKHHHKVSSTTETLSSESAEILESSAKADSTSEDPSSGEKEPPKGVDKDGHHSTEPVLQQGSTYQYQDAKARFIIRIVIIVGCVVLFVLILGCIGCCCSGCCGRSRDRTGFIIRDVRSAEVYPQQPIIAPALPQQPVIIQHQPPNYTQEPVQPFTAQYPQQPVHHYPPPQYGQQTYPSAPPQNLQFYNPPEAPPPYEDKANRNH